MKRFLIWLLVGIIFSQSDLVAQSSKKSVTRSVKFIELKDSLNTPFWGVYREIPRLVMTAIKKEVIKPLVVDYDNKAAVTQLSMSEYEQRIQFLQPINISGENNDYLALDYLFPTDLPYIGLDQTISIADGKESVHVHYVNFYSHENFSKDRKIREYRFSVRWDDFVKILKQRKDLLYTPNTYGAWWRGDVFITNERYLIESQTSDFIELSRLQGIEPKDFTYSKNVQTVDSLKKKNYDPSMMDVYFLEENYKNSWKINRLAFGTVPEEMSYLKERRFVYAWEDFVKVLAVHEHNISKEIYTLADAFVLKKFSYSTTINPILISKNGKFKSGGQDVLCTTSLNESFEKMLPTVANTKFHTQLLENIYLGDTTNKLLNIPGHSIAEIIHGHIMDGTLLAYQDDSLNREMTVEIFKSNASQYLDVSAIEPGKKYEKGDTVSMYINDEKYWYGETRYFIVQKKFIASYFDNDSTFMLNLKRYYPPLVPVEELTALELMHDLSFDRDGKNKKYKLKALALYVSADGPSNIKGIQYSICYVRWKDLKAVLLNDPRATFIYQGRERNLINMIENREFLSILLKTGFVEIDE